MTKPDPDPNLARLSAVPEEDVRAALDRMIAHPAFGASERRIDFLRFVVGEALAGRGKDLKGFTVAQKVFDRDQSFDPRSDPVVRIEARRLRQDLDSFYVGPGAADPVRISIPKGGYQPYFELLNNVSPPAAPLERPQEGIDTSHADKAGDGGWKIPLIAVAVAGLAIVAIVLSWMYRTQDNATAYHVPTQLPRVAILPFEALDASATTRTLSLGLSSETLLKLGEFGTLRLFAPVSSNNVNEIFTELGSDEIPTYVVHSTVQTEGARVLVNVQLQSVSTGELVWGDSYDLHLNHEALIGLSDSISAEIATAIGQPYGPLNEDVRARTRDYLPESLESYLCVLQAYSYRRTFSGESFVPVRTCLEATVARYPDYVEALAMLGWLHLDAARYRFVAAELVEAEYAAALEVAERAYALAPDNVLAVRALSSIQHHIGNYAEGERLGRIALELNPYDPDTLAQVGWRLSVRGKYDEGGALMEQAIQRTVDPPGWYYHLPSLQHFMQGDPEQALKEAEIAASKGTGFAWFLIAINAAALGDVDKAATALEELSKHPAIGSDPKDFMRRHGATDSILEKTMAEYQEAQRLVSDPVGSEPAAKR